MATSIPAVTGNVNIASSLFIDLQLGDTTYYISDSYKNITLNGNVYDGLCYLMSVSDFTYDYKTTQGTNQIVLSGIPEDPDLINIIQASKIRGGDVEIRRAFYNTDTLEILSGEDYLRFKGIISTYLIEEQSDFYTGSSTNTLVLECTSVYSVLSNKVSGQRTNGSDRRRFYAGDISFDNVANIRVLPEFDEQ